MKHLRINILSIFASLSLFHLGAQGIIEVETGLPNSFGTNQQHLNYLLLQSNETIASSNMNVVNKGIFIHQIGNNNYSDISASVQISDIHLHQFGNDNTIDLDLKAAVIDYSVTQNGNNNSLIEYNNSINNKQLLERTIQQNGNGQNLIIEGNNGIVDKMRITMDNGSQSLIIRSIN